MPNRIKAVLCKPAILAVALLGLSGAALATAGAASASVISSPLTATTSLTNRGDSGNGTPTYWATDTLTRTATLTDNGPDASAAGQENYTLTLVDTGTFVTNSGATNPNGDGVTIANAPLSGSVNGGGSFSFDVSDKVTPSVSGVPASMSGTPSGSCTAASCSSSDWPELFFPAGTVITYTAPNEDDGNFSYTYVTGQTCEQWVDASTDDYGTAGTPGAGGIQGRDDCVTTLTAPTSVIAPAGQVLTITNTGSTTSSNPQLLFTYAHLPSWLTPQGTVHAAVSGTPPVADAGDTFTYYVTVCDSYGKCVTGKTEVHVVAASATPAPSPSVTTTSSGTSSSSSATTPSGGVQTGGGKAPGSPWQPLGIVLTAFGLLSLAAAGTAGLRRKAGRSQA